jgi:cell division protein ZapA
MTKPVQAVSLNILDKEYKIACAPGEREALIHSAQALDKQMRKIRETGKVAGADRIAVLAALNLAHDADGGRNDFDDDNLNLRLSDMRKKIEKALENP